jgi:Ca2+-binding RTX toxin-like protein
MAIIANTLTDKVLFANYLDAIRKYSQKWLTASIPERVFFFQKLANQITTIVGIPPIGVDGTSKNLDSLFVVGVFDPQYRIFLNKDRVAIRSNARANAADSQSIESDFFKVAVQFYHELRHAEQYIRGAQYYYQKNNVTAKQLGFDPNTIIPPNIVDRLRSPSSPKGFLKLPTSQENYARTMLTYGLGYERGKDSGIPELKKVAEKDAYILSREGYKILYNGNPPKNFSGTSWLAKAFTQLDSKSLDGSPSNSLSNSIRFSRNQVLVDGVPITPELSSSALTEIIGDIANNTLDASVAIVAGPGAPIDGSYSISGQAGNDVIKGFNGDDYLSGDEGDDTITGGNGDDQLIGGEGNDSLDGGDGNDLLEGGTGVDTLNGGTGDDSYYIDNVGDLITGETSTSGTDTVFSSISINLGANLENLNLIGEGNITGAGNSLNNFLVGNNKINILNGLAGDDVLYGLDGNDTLRGGEGNDYLDGDNNPAIADGDSELDRPVYVGADRLEGGIGNDTYVVNATGDTVVENSNEGTDTVISIISYNLGANLENLTLAGEGNITGAGNTLDNDITGNDQVNILNGLAGNDTIAGEGGNDELIGDLGDDNLDGGEGNDTINGNNGNDVLTGGEGDDFLYGDSGSDSIQAGAGNDVLIGGDDNDLLSGNDGNDAIYGDGGNDTIFGGEGDDVINGNDGNDVITAGNGSDILYGDMGDDILVGNDGNDTLTGGSGFDRFALGTPNQPFVPTTSGVDVLVDFQGGIDKIQIQRNSFTAITTVVGSLLKAGEFALVSSDLAADTSAGLIVYSQASGRLFYNSNGALSGYGSGGELAILNGQPVLKASDFVVA